MLSKTRLARLIAAIVMLSIICISYVCPPVISAEYSGKSGSSGGVTNNPTHGVPDNVSPGAPASFESWKNIPRRKEARVSWNELAGWKIIVHVSLQSDLNSSSARPGDLVWGLLDDDLKWGAKLIAARNSLIRGHIESCRRGRTLCRAALSSDRRLHKDGSLTIHFDQIEDPVNNTSWPISGKICRWNNITRTSGGGWRQIEVDGNGRIVKAGPCLSETEKNVFLAAKLATYTPIPGSLWVNWAVMPAVMGIAGAVYPSFVYDKPVNHKERHIRERAFAYGFVTNLPGAGVVQACVQKGEAAQVQLGDQIAVDLVFRENPNYSANVNVVQDTSSK